MSHYLYVRRSLRARYNVFGTINFKRFRNDSTKGLAPDEPFLDLPLNIRVACLISMDKNESDWDSILIWQALTEYYIVSASRHQEAMKAVFHSYKP